jgi:hypothetical protein
MAGDQVLAYGTYGRNDRSTLERLAEEADLRVQFADDAEGAAQWLRANVPRMLLVESASDDAARVGQLTRSKRERQAVPIIRMTRELDDLSFEEVFSWGGDDVIRYDAARGLLSRLRSLPKDPAPARVASKGVAIVADPDRARRLVRARVLRNAGYSVRFSVSAEDTLRFARELSTRVLVVDWDLDGTAEIIQECGLTKHTNMILMCPPRKVHPVARQLDGLGNIAVTDSFAPPENMLFIINEMQIGGAKTNRTSRRLLYGTTVAFRGEGRDEDDYGFSFNVSAEGLFVRTLAPPVDELVWLELRPPRADRKVRLEGEVSWRQHFGASTNATSPPGFGVRITDATRRNRTLWSQGYEEFGAALGLTTQFIPRAS